jgi:hypothetical protein
VLFLRGRERASKNQLEIVYSRFPAQQNRNVCHRIVPRPGCKRAFESIHSLRRIRALIYTETVQSERLSASGPIIFYYYPRAAPIAIRFDNNHRIFPSNAGNIHKYKSLCCPGEGGEKTALEEGRSRGTHKVTWRNTQFTANLSRLPTSQRFTLRRHRRSGGNISWEVIESNR